MTVVEATGGSTGSSLALVCAVKRYKFLAVTSDLFAAEKLRTMQSFGATLDLVHSPGGITPDLFPSMTRRAKEAAESDGCYLTNQFYNKDALVGYEEMGNELTKQFPDGIYAFCGAASSAGMLMGVSKVLKAKWPQTRVVVLEPMSSPVITEGRSGPHSVEGVDPGFLAPHLDDKLYDEARAISVQEGRTMSRLLANEEGLLVGTSTGLNVEAAIALAQELGPGKRVVTVAVDTGLKYMNGNLFVDACYNYLKHLTKFQPSTSVQFHILFHRWQCKSPKSVP